jgi:hypothetical protein
LYLRGSRYCNTDLPCRDQTPAPHLLQVVLQIYLPFWLESISLTALGENDFVFARSDSLFREARLLGIAQAAGAPTHPLRIDNGELPTTEAEAALDAFG